MLITWDDTTQSVAAWARDPRRVVSRCALRERLRGGMNPEEAMTIRRIKETRPRRRTQRTP